MYVLTVEVNIGAGSLIKKKLKLVFSEKTVLK